jgi:hypothetical protein
LGEIVEFWRPMFNYDQHIGEKEIVPIGVEGGMISVGGGVSTRGGTVLYCKPPGRGAFLGFSNRPSRSHNVVVRGIRICNGKNCLDSE